MPHKSQISQIYRNNILARKKQMAKILENQKNPASKKISIGPLDTICSKTTKCTPSQISDSGRSLMSAVSNL